MKDGRNLWSGGSLVLLAVLFIGLVMLSETVFKGWRLDLTQNSQYTLSEGTRNILDTLEEPVTVHLFFSEDASKELPQVRSYARWVGEMLDEMADRSDGKLTIRRINPEPFSPEEDQATQFGLQGVPVGAAGDNLYLGLAGTNSLDDVQVMPFLQPAKEQFFEYDMAKMLSTLSSPSQRKVGLLSSLDMAPGFDMATRQPRPAWVVYEQLEQLFEVTSVDPAATALPDDIELLFLVHPSALSEDLRYAIDQFVLGGGRLVAFMDPFAESDLGDDPSDPMARLNAGSASDLGSLLQAWGVRYDSSKVAGDLRYALQVSGGPGLPPVRHLGILSVDPDGMDQQDIVSADLESVNVSSSGWLEPLDGATTTFQPLVQTSENAAPLDASRLRFLGNPADLMSGFTPTGDRFALAARITGPASSAYSEPPAGHAGEPHLGDAAVAGINVILFADTDILTDRLWVSRQPFFGQSLVNAFADNGTLVVNSVDNLLGASDLISIRTRASSARPFGLVEQLRLEAEGRFRATEEQLNRELETTEQTLAQMQSSRTEGDLSVLNEDQQAELQRFIDQRIRIRGELREVRHDLQSDINALGTRLKVINIALLPLLVIGVALLLWHLRRQRREAGQP
jgi:ABC-type uncharacterized transport system involved in gliding motility auxiliary subunit